MGRLPVSMGSIDPHKRDRSLCSCAPAPRTVKGMELTTLFL